MGELPAAKTLSCHFEIIFHTLGCPDDDRQVQQVNALFSCGHNAFRDVLSEEAPRLFPCRGPVFACLSDILISLSCKQSSSRYFSFIASCGGPNCNIRVTTSEGAPFMLTPYTWTTITRLEDPPYHESLRDWITQYFNYKVLSLSHSCPRCRTECPWTRSFLGLPWIWFEVFVGQANVVLPLFELLFPLHTYRLAAVIYGNARHFVTRLSTPSGTWWHYDSQDNSRRPVVDAIAHEEDLITCRGGYTMNVLVYCRTR